MAPLPPRRAGSAPAAQPDPLRDADRCERNGDLGGAVAALRQHLDARPDDAQNRLRLGRLLSQAGDLPAARRHLAALDRPGTWPDEHARQANRTLAELDEAEGALASAALRWERLARTPCRRPPARRPR